MVEIKVTNGEQVSDGHHTFEELYEHRITLWMSLCRRLDSWKSRKHSDGSVMHGWFVLGVGVEDGQQITYHLPERKWDECGFAVTLEHAPEWDGHTSNDVLERLRML